jgi:hypothetical protein
MKVYKQKPISLNLYNQTKLGYLELWTQPNMLEIIIREIYHSNQQHQKRFWNKFRKISHYKEFANKRLN